MTSTLLSDYEQLRARNIERNNQRLRELGLISILEEQQSNDSAWGRHGSGGSANKDDDDGLDLAATTTKIRKNNNKKKKRTLQESTNESAIASRKSARLQGLDPELGGINEDGDSSDNGSGSSTTNDGNNRSVDQLRKDRVEECRSVRNKRLMLYGGTDNEEEDTKTFEKAKQENPTASYGHCLMRVRTMSEKQLQNRIKMIERAAGKHCVVKMVRVFLILSVLSIDSILLANFQYQSACTGDKELTSYANTSFIFLSATLHTHTHTLEIGHFQMLFTR